MANGTDLLRMLEPAVRPIQLPNGSDVLSVNPPFEKQDFDQLLHEAKMMTAIPAIDSQPADIDANQKELQVNVLSELSRIDSIENASLREILNVNRQHSML